MKEFLKKILIRICPEKHSHIRSDVDINKLARFLKEFPTLDIPIETRIGILQGIYWMKGMDTVTARNKAVSLLCDDDPSLDTVHIFDRYNVDKRPLCDPENSTPETKLVSGEDLSNVTCKRCLSVLSIYIQLSNVRYTEYDEDTLKLIDARIKELK